MTRNAVFTVMCLFVVAVYSSPRAGAEISANFKAGAVVVGPAGDAECTTITEGALRWSSADKTHEMCDGASWKRIIAAGGAGTPSMPQAGSGYFVITSQAWTGDLRTAGAGVDGFDGAHKLCLSDLQANDWMGKADANARGLISSTNVRAFLCPHSNGTCQNTLPNVTYYFAVSGDATKGGASFVSDNDSRGPANTQNWAGVNYFDGEKSFWTARRSDVSTTLWMVSGVNDAGHSCQNWSSGAIAWGVGGNTNRTNTERWTINNMHCGVARHLICMVHP